MIGVKSYPVATGTTIYKGAMVCTNSTGYLVPAADTSGYSNVLGVADEQVVNSGADGAKNCRVVCGRAFLFAATSITQAMVGDQMFVAYDNQFDDSSSNGIRAGILVEYVSTTSGWIMIHGPQITPTAIGTSDISSAAVTAAKLSSTLKTGFVNIPLTSLRLIAAAHVASSGAADGGVLSGDTAPILDRINAGTDPALAVQWVATDVVPVTAQFAYPPDLDDTQAVTVNLLVRKDANMDASAAIAVGYFEGKGDSDAGGTSGAITNTTTPTKKTVTIAAGDIGAAPAAATIILTPGTHANDALYLDALWVEYTRK